MSGFADIYELKGCIGFKKQAALHTALVAADTWNLHRTNPDINTPQFLIDTNRDDFGKGTPFATQSFKNRIEQELVWNARLTSENAAMIAAFGLGDVTKTAAGAGFKYTCVPLDVITDGVTMPSTTAVVAVRQGASDLFDYALVGLALDEWSISLQNGTGRDTASISTRWVGSGKYVAPSTVTIPASFAEHYLNIGAVSALTIRSQNYLSNLRFVNLTLGWRNNISAELAYFPGAGTQSGFALKGRMLRGRPECTLGFTALFENGSTELDDFLAQTEGTAVIDLTGAVFDTTQNHKVEIDLHRVVFRAVNFTQIENFIGVTVECEVMEHNSNGVITMAVTCEQDNIGTAAS